MHGVYIYTTRLGELAFMRTSHLQSSMQCVHEDSSILYRSLCIHPLVDLRQTFPLDGNCWTLYYIFQFLLCSPSFRNFILTVRITLSWITSIFKVTLRKPSLMITKSKENRANIQSGGIKKTYEKTGWGLLIQIFQKLFSFREH